MENKQTAVEWLVNELNQKIDFIPMDKWDIIRDIVQQALAMEKEQIIDAWKNAEGYNDLTNENLAEQYYNETYKQ
jgi:hypothetical protein